jgi:hypothetical protein
MTTAAMATYAYDQIDQPEQNSNTPAECLLKAWCAGRGVPPALVEAGSPGSVEGGAGPSRLLVRARLHRKGFTAVDTFEFNGDGPGWALLPQPGPFVARSSDMVRAAIEEVEDRGRPEQL